MDLHITFEGRHDLSGQVYRQVRAAILDGRLGPGDRLPPTRDLAARLEVSRNTVAVAYEWLTSEGLVHGRSGAGSFVEPTVSADGRPRPPARGAPIRVRPVWDGIASPPDRGPAPRHDFDAGIPDARLFPFDAWRRRVARQIRAGSLTSAYGEPGGHPPLRAAIARHVGVSRGVRAVPEDVVVTNGAQQAFDLIGRVLLEPGDRVAVEDPGYPPARQLFESLGARVAGVRVDAEGLDVGALPADARLVYVTPSHQFPLGVPLSRARRGALLAWAERRNAVVVEDDYDSEFRFGGRPLDTLQAIDRGGRVIYVGSFSKVMLPALRLGFLVAPPSLRRSLITASFVAGWHAPGPSQAALARFMDDGSLARHIRRMRREYAARHQRIVDRLESDLAPWVDVVPSTTGMHLSVRLRRSSLRLEREVASRALAAGVRLGRLSTFHASEPPTTGFVLGYGAIAREAIDEGLRRLRTCLERVAARG